MKVKVKKKVSKVRKKAPKPKPKPISQLMIESAVETMGRVYDPEITVYPAPSLTKDTNSGESWFTYMGKPSRVSVYDEAAVRYFNLEAQQIVAALYEARIQIRSVEDDRIPFCPEHS